MNRITAEKNVLSKVADVTDFVKYFGTKTWEKPPAPNSAAYDHPAFVLRCCLAVRAEKRTKEGVARALGFFCSLPIIIIIITIIIIIIIMMMMIMIIIMIMIMIMIMIIIIMII